MDTAHEIRPVSQPAAMTPRRDRAISVALLGLWTVFAIWQRWGLWGEDLSAVYIAGWLWHSGMEELIYAAPHTFFGGVAESWRPAMAAMGIGDQTSFAYVYPPVWAVLTAPLTGWLDAQSFINAVALVQIPLLAASVWLAGRLLKPDTMPWWLWAALGVTILCASVQVHLAIWHNQPTITVGFLVLLAFERLGARRPVIAGAVLALAAAIKLTPAAFFLLFLVDRQWRAAAAFVVAGSALAGLSVALAGWPAHQAFLDSLARVQGVAFLIAINVSVLPALLAAGSAVGLMPPIDPQSTQYLFPQVPGWLSPATALVGLALTAAFLRTLAAAAGPVRRGIGLLALSLLVALFGPLGWLHYYVVPLLLLPGLLAFLPQRTALWLVALVGIPSITPLIGLIGVLPWPIANYVWFMCLAWGAVLAAIFVALRRSGD